VEEALVEELREKRVHLLVPVKAAQGVSGLVCYPREGMTRTKSAQVTSFAEFVDIVLQLAFFSHQLSPPRCNGLKDIENLVKAFLARRAVELEDLINLKFLSHGEFKFEKTLSGWEDVGPTHNVFGIVPSGDLG
jgi:hypothetical protein